jgi:hypothetical protein
MICNKSKILKLYCTDNNYLKICNNISKEYGADLFSEIYLALLKTKAVIKENELKYFVAKIATNMMSKNGVINRYFKKNHFRDFAVHTDFEGFYISADKDYHLYNIPDEDNDYYYHNLLDKIELTFNSLDKKDKKVLQKTIKYKYKRHAYQTKTISRYAIDKAINNFKKQWLNTTLTTTP